MTRAVFLDRDGTLNREVDFVRKVEDLEVLPGVPAALQRLDAAGYRLVVLTNQSGIARGYLDERDLARIHAALHERLHRLPLAWLHCPHHPDGGHGYGGACACRKPAPGLLQQAQKLFGFDLHGSAMIGDSARDLLPARGLPLVTIHVRSGKPFAAEQAKLRAAGFTPDHEAADLAAAVDWLCARGGG